MRDKLLAKLKAKYPGLPLQLLGLYADKLAVTTTEETEIDNAIATLDTLPVPIADQAAFFQTEGDRRATAAVTTAKAKWDAEKGNPTPLNPTPGPEPKGGPDDDLKTQLANLTKLVSDMATEKQQTSLTEKLHKACADKKIPLEFLKGRSLESAEKLDEVVAEIEADYTAVKQALINDGLDMKPPGGGNVATTAVDSAIDAWVGADK